MWEAWQRIRAFIIWIWQALKTQPSVDTIVDERVNEIPDEHVPRVKRRLQEHRERIAK